MNLTRCFASSKKRDLSSEQSKAGGDTNKKERRQPNYKFFRKGLCFLGRIKILQLS